MMTYMHLLREHGAGKKVLENLGTYTRAGNIRISFQIWPSRTVHICVHYSNNNYAVGEYLIEL